MIMRVFLVTFSLYGSWDPYRLNRYHRFGDFDQSFKLVNILTHLRTLSYFLVQPQRGDVMLQYVYVLCV